MRIVVFGATGFTGQLVVSQLRALGVRDLILAGRSKERLEALQPRRGEELRVADATRPDSLGALLRDVRVVVSTVGPFLRYGEPVVRAAQDAGAHFLDTTGEQAYVARLIERYHGAAVEKKIAIVNAHAFEFALGICAASLLCDAHPEVQGVDVFNRVGGTGASRGTQKSALAALQEEALIRRHGRLVPRGPSPLPLRVRFPGDEKAALAVPFPGTEALFLSRAHPNVRDISTNLVLPRALSLAAMGLWSGRSVLRPLRHLGALAWLESQIDSGDEGPTAQARAAADFTVLAQGRSPRGTPATTVRGADPYGITGVLAAQGAQRLVTQGPLKVGVVSSAEAFGAKRVLDDLGAHGVRYAHHD
jgi:short subunit dehydrogenase-like uncharacterized protein